MFTQANKMCICMYLYVLMHCGTHTVNHAAHHRHWCTFEDGSIFIHSSSPTIVDWKLVWDMSLLTEEPLSAFFVSPMTAVLILPDTALTVEDTVPHHEWELLVWICQKCTSSNDPANTCDCTLWCTCLRTWHRSNYK